MTNEVLEKLGHTVGPLTDEELDQAAGGREKGMRVDNDSDGKPHTSSVTGACATDCLD
jgi:hypothetical protein